ncbi:hypothetical protein FACS189492_0150 [Clostridia bacterium]|nr:hypothetical protein FACS189492_0150 [Clostridia bacterium]
MEKTGVVIKIEGETAIVRIPREVSCGENCAACNGCNIAASIDVKANNFTGAKPGDRVTVALADKKVLGAAFVFYVLPVITLIGGYALFRAVGAVVGFCLPLLVLWLTDRRNAAKYTAKITKIWSADP